MNLIWSVIPQYFDYLMSGLQMTLIIAALSIFFGFAGGLLVGMGRISRNKLVYGLSTIYVEAFRGTPLLVQIFLVYSGLPSLGIFLDPLTAGLIALSMNTAAYQAEIFRGGVQSIPKGQMEAARSMGLTYTQSMLKVIIPQALRNSLPSYTNEFITMIKDSSLVYSIGVVELILAARNVIGYTFQPFVVLIFIAMLYFLVTFSTSRIMRYVERRFATPGMMGSE
ncbi:MAG: amino acid ABC transporter permease [Methanomassiliicoccales archaeon]|jgi:polar amino acid transport system permease protein